MATIKTLLLLKIIFVATLLLQATSQFLAEEQDQNQASLPTYSKDCDSNLQKTFTEMAICETCKVKTVYLVIGEDWKKIPLSAEQRAQALNYFKKIDAALPFSNFTMGFSNSILCFGSERIAGMQNLTSMLTELGVYNFQNAELKKFFKISDQFKAYEAIFWADWNKGFQEVFFKTNQESTAPIATPANELKLQLKVLSFDTRLKAVRYSGTADYKGRKGEVFDKFEINMSKTELQTGDRAYTIIKPTQNLTISQLIVPMENQLFMDQIPAPKGISDIDNMQALRLNFTLTSKNSQISLLSYEAESQKLENIAIVPKFNITNATMHLTVIGHASFKVELIGDAHLGKLIYFANLNYNEPSGAFQILITPKPGKPSMMKASDIEESLIQVVAAENLKVTISPKSAEKSVQAIIDKLSLQNIIIDQSSVLMTFTPDPIILIRGISSFYNNKDAEVEIVLSNNGGKVEVIVALIFNKEDNAMNALSKVLSLNSKSAVASLKSNFEVNKVAFILSRNDLLLQDAPQLAKSGSSCLLTTMDMNQGLNFLLNASVDAHCGPKDSFCHFLTKINKDMNANLFASLKQGKILLTGPMGKKHLSIGKGLVVTDPSLNIIIKVGKDLETLMRGTIENFSVFSGQANITPQFATEIKQDEAQNLSMVAQSVDVIHAMTIPKDMVDMVYLRIESSIIEGDLQSANLQGVAMFGSECIVLPPDYTKSVMYLLAHNNTQVESKAAQVSENCLASWVEFGHIKDYSVPKAISYTGIIKVSTFATLLQPFFTNAQNKATFMKDIRFKLIPAITDDFRFKESWIKLTYDPNHKSSPAYLFEAPSKFLGIDGHTKGFILPQKQEISASLTLLPISILHFNLKIQSSEYNYFTQDNKIEKAQGFLKYTPTLPPTEQMVLKMTVEMFQVRKNIEASITRAGMTFDLEGANVYGGFIPMLVRVSGNYASNMKDIPFTAHGQISSNEARLEIERLIVDKMRALKKGASDVLNYVAGQKAKTVELLRKANVVTACDKEACPLVKMCATGKDQRPQLHCLKYKKKEVCKSSTDICPHFVQECSEREKHCSITNPKSSSKCKAEYEICKKWVNKCTGSIIKTCTDYETEYNKNECDVFSYYCSTEEKREQLCIRKCELQEMRQQYLKERLQLQTEVEKQVLQWFHWRYFLNTIDDQQGKFVELQALSFDVKLHEKFLNPRDIPVVVTMRLGFQPNTKQIEMQTNMQIIANKQLLMNELANGILQEVVQGQENENLAVWKDVNMVKDLLEGSLQEDLKSGNLKQQVSKIIGKIIVEVKNLKDNHKEKTSYLESLRVPNDSDPLLPKDLMTVFSKLAMRPDKVIDFKVVNPGASQDSEESKEKNQEESQHSGMKKDPAKFVKNGLSASHK